MTHDSVLRKLKRVLAEEPSLNLSSSRISDDVALMDGGLELDSIGILEVLTLAERSFGFQFQDEDLRVATFATVRSLADVIFKRMNA